MAGLDVCKFRRNVKASTVAIWNGGSAVVDMDGEESMCSSICAFSARLDPCSAEGDGSWSCSYLVEGGPFYEILEMGTELEREKSAL